MLTYAIGDIHGCLDDLRSLWDKIKTDAGNKEHRIVCLGDYIDRGPDSKGVVDFLIANMRENRDVPLMGNHEDMLLRAVHGETGYGELFWSNGGWATMQSYGIAPDQEVVIPDEHAQWFLNLRLNYITEKQYFVHAGITPAWPLGSQPRDVRLWARQEFLCLKMQFDSYIVHGHTPVNFDPQRPKDESASLFLNPLDKPSIFEPLILDNRCNLDTEAVFGGKLSAGVFDNSQEKPLNIISHR